MKIGENKEETLAYIRQFEKLYVYGAGYFGKIMVQELTDKGCTINAVVVTCREGNPEELEGIPVLELAEIPVEEQNLFVLGVSGDYAGEIAETLTRKGHGNILQFENPYVLRGVISGKMRAKIPVLEITAKMGCSVQCRFCPQGQLMRAYFCEDKHRRSEMTMEDYKTCVLRMPKGSIISFAGFVEPFHHPDAVEMMVFAHEMGYQVELFTTFDGVTLEQFEQIKDIPFGQVVLHTPDKLGYANIHTDGDYWKIINLALSHRKPNGMPFVDEANCQSEPTEEFLKVAQGRIQVLSELNDRAGNLGEDEHLKKHLHTTENIYCSRSYRQNHWVLLPDGTVTLCCMDFGLRHPLGNLLESSHEELMRSEAYIRIRRQMQNLEDGSDLICRNCVSAACMPKPI